LRFATEGKGNVRITPLDADTVGTGHSKNAPASGQNEKWFDSLLRKPSMCVNIQQMRYSMRVGR